MAFDKLYARKFKPRSGHFVRPATINGRPAHEVVEERRRAREEPPCRS